MNDLDLLDVTLVCEVHNSVGCSFADRMVGLGGTLEINARVRLCTYICIPISQLSWPLAVVYFKADPSMMTLCTVGCPYLHTFRS